MVLFGAPLERARECVGGRRLLACRQQASEGIAGRFLWSLASVSPGPWPGLAWRAPTERALAVEAMGPPGICQMQARLRLVAGARGEGRWCGQEEVVEVGQGAAECGSAGAGRPHAPASCSLPESVPGQLDKLWPSPGPRQGAGALIHAGIIHRRAATRCRPACCSAAGQGPPATSREAHQHTRPGATSKHTGRHSRQAAGRQGGWQLTDRLWMAWPPTAPHQQHVPCAMPGTMGAPPVQQRERSRRPPPRIRMEHARRTCGDSCVCVHTMRQCRRPGRRAASKNMDTGLSCPNRQVSGGRRAARRRARQRVYGGGRYALAAASRGNDLPAGRTWWDK